MRVLNRCKLPEATISSGKAFQGLTTLDEKNIYECYNCLEEWWVLMSVPVYETG